MIELIRRAAGSPDARFGQLLAMATLKLPDTMNTILPFGVMLGGMVAFWRLARSHELVVMRASGVSAWQFLMPIMLVVFLLGVVNVMAVNPVAAAFYGRFEKMEDAVLKHNSPFTLSEGGMWLREPIEGRQYVVHAERVRQSGTELRMTKVSMFAFEGQDRFIERTDAAVATLEGGLYHLKDVWIMQPGLPPVHRDAMEAPTTLTLAKIQENFASPQTVSFWELPRFIQFFEASGFSAHKHRLHFLSLVASPFLLCAMVLVASAFSTRPNLRSGGLLRRTVIGVGFGILLYFFSKVTYALGLSTTLPLWLAAWSPTAITALLGLGTVFHLEDG